MSSSPPVAPSRRSASRLFVPVLAAVALFIGLMAGVPAQASGPFSLTGVVSGEEVGPVEGALVELQKYNVQDEYFMSEDSTYTEAGGTYAFPSVEAGATYRVRVTADTFTRSTSPQFVLSADKSLDVALSTGGSVSGTVVEDGTGVPVYLAVVEVYPFNGTTVDEGDRSYTTSDEDGKFKVDGLAPGTYKVKVSDALEVHVTEFYADASTLADAATVEVAKGADQPLGAIGLAVGGSVTGRVVDDAGVLVENPEVMALRVLPDGEADYENAYRASIGEDGNYTVRGLPTGHYKISFSEYSDVYFDQFYTGKTTVGSADALAVVQGAGPVNLGTTALERRGSVTGTVMKSATATFSDALVEAFPVVGGVVGTEAADYAYTEPDGTFTMNSLHAGTYQIVYRDGLHAYLDKTGAQFTIATGGTFDAGTVTMVKKPVKKSASVKATPVGGKRKVTFTVKVTASGVTPTGKVTVKLGSKTLKTVTLKSGKATVTVTGQAKGRRSYTVVYSGDAKVLAKTVTTSKVTIT